MYKYLWMIAGFLPLFVAFALGETLATFFEWPQALGVLGYLLMGMSICCLKRLDGMIATWFSSQLLLSILWFLTYLHFNNGYSDTALLIYFVAAIGTLVTFWRRSALCFLLYLGHLVIIASNMFLLNVVYHG